MKRKSILAASLISLAAALSFTARAASDTAIDVKSDASASQDQPKKKMKPHSHMEEKTGMSPQKTEDKKSEETTSDQPKTAKANPAKDKSKHFHPRDGK